MPSYWFDHIHVFSPDPIRTAEFYERMFNAKVLDTRHISAERTSVELDLNGTKILILTRRDQPESTPTSSEVSSHALDHFGLATNNLEESVNDLKKKGVEFTLDATAVRPGLKIAFLRAPENVSIELVEQKE